MGGTTGNLSTLLQSFGFAALIALVAAVMLIVVGQQDWNAAAFFGLLAGAAVAALLGFVLGKPLPGLAEMQSRPAPVVARSAAPAMAPVAAPAAPVAAAVDTLAATPALAVVDDAAVAAAGVGKRPVALSGPRAGKADDLKNIQGIGPVLEKLCHDMGIYHFDQIASWGPPEVAWMNANLEGFKGRVGRDHWVSQARLIGTVGMEEFKRRAEVNAY